MIDLCGFFDLVSPDGRILLGSGDVLVGAASPIPSRKMCYNLVGVIDRTDGKV